MPRIEARVLIVGAGPAGIAAAVAARQAGADVVVLDDNPAPGGQIWRGAGVTMKASAEAVPPEAPQGSSKQEWLRVFQSSGARVLHQTRVIGVLGDGVLLAERDGEPLHCRYDKLILATGARELFLPFPGWTLPGIAGAGGLQALAQGGAPVEGKRVLVAGSGPLLLAVAAHLLDHGAEVAGIVEQAPRWKMLKMAGPVLRSTEKWQQARELFRRLRGVKRYFSAWPITATGTERVDSVVLQTRRGLRSVECDLVACGFGLIPNVELAASLGCELRAGSVVVDQWQRTTLPRVYCAGEPTGIGGVEKSLVEGRIAGLHAAAPSEPADLDPFQPLFQQRAETHAFARTLSSTYALRRELKSIAWPDTVVCRCEDVRMISTDPAENWRDAKLQTRCGMGACQGRVCGAALRFIKDWDDVPGAVRPPVVPASMGTLCSAGEPRQPRNGLGD